MDAGTHHPLRAMSPSDVLAQWASGIMLVEIAAGMGVSTQAVQQWLARNTSPEQYEDAKIAHYQARHDDGLARLTRASEDRDVELARATEPYLRRLEWRMQCELRSIYGQHQHIIHEQAPIAMSRDQILRSIAELERSLVVSDQQQSSATLPSDTDDAVDIDCR
jgi:predicted transcriptional regulator